MEHTFSIGGISSKMEMVSDGGKAAGTGAIRSHRKEQEEDRKSIYMGSIRQETGQDAVSEKYALAQKKAIKTILDQMEDDFATDDEMAEEISHVQQLQEDVRGYYDSLDTVQARRERIIETCQADADSQEQKDLELLQKAEKAGREPLNPEYMLTDEEKERLASLGEKTKYQEDMLLCDQEEQAYLDKITTARRDITVGKATVNATKKALLQVHPMVDAIGEAETILEAANKERIGSLYQEGVDEIEEKNAESQSEMVENQEQALEEKVKRQEMEAEEAKQEESEEEMMNSVLSATLQALTYGQQISDNVQRNVENLIQDQILLDVDLKGLRVDNQV